jgi:hypothetical protein
MKDKQEKNDMENFFFKFIFAKIFTDARVRSIVFFGFVQYLPTPELKIFVGIVH